MLKMIFLLVGLAGGFGGGVYWAHHNPDAAAKVSAEEERRIAQAKLDVTRKFREKLDQLASKTSAKPAGGSSGFLGSGQAPSGVSAADVSSVRDEAKREEEQLQKEAAGVK
jgi:hypothetical protein